MTDPSPSLLTRWTSELEHALEERLPPASTPPARLHQAMRYSVLAGGKRLRPLFCLAAARAAGGEPRAAHTAAIALELLHTYTLIHDDLPGMDDDALRRGRPTCHIEFDEATAILAGDALLTLALTSLADAPAAPARLVRELGEAAGSRGVIAGQAEDMAAEGAPPSEETLATIHRHKTGDLFRAATRMGAIAAGAPDPVVETLGRAGLEIGIAFQYVDDILNATGDPARLGKAAGTDATRGKLTSVALYGVDGARSRASHRIGKALAACAGLPGPADALETLAHRCLDRLS